MSLSQNKKIMVSALAVFAISFSSMILFLTKGADDSSHMQSDVLGTDGHVNSESHVSGPPLWSDETIYRNFVDEKDDPIFGINSEGDIEFVTDDFCEMISVECKRAEGQKFFDFINTKDLSDLFAEQTKLIQSGEVTKAIGPYRMLNGDEEILVLFNAYPIFNKEEKVEKVIFTVNDLTAQVSEMNVEEEDAEVEEHKAEIEQKFEENKNNDTGQEKKKKEENWMKHLYPKVKEINDQKKIKDVKTLVDKITFLW